ncbi:class I SAM-dependent methyltransferase [Brevifollis gellanilyticus]|uniref:SAM-dependent methyltransferase n=1 Tax=Brevifollis gellanilyticus TaxID=748831 RepID=A0A512MD79_9BACT|nr:class I SAM-dependent methyltransferase [Brevifollis gellanilyticus]GEP44693.1 SAM-dependent methyltransferase [Brevifollis gellanilyticus]
MSPAEHKILRESEEQHWWYAVLHQLVLAEMHAHVKPGAAVLDAGCGTGGMMARLAKWDIQGVDISAAAVSHCHERGLHEARQASVCELPFPDASFDSVLSLDVLYHQEVHETSALDEMARVLRPGGLMILNLPAMNCLRGAHDKAVCGSRRYTACHMRDLLRKRRFEVRMIHYWNAWLFLPLLAWRWWSRRSRECRSDLRSMPEMMNRILMRAGHLDARLCRHVRPPFGSSIFAVAHRPETV